MSKTRGEGRSESEKSNSVITPYGIRMRELDEARKEEDRWASLSGPVTVRKKSD